MENLLRHRWMPLVVIAVVTFAVFSINVGNELVLWDDLLLLKDTKAVHSISIESLRWIFTHFDPELYIPLTFFSYQIDHAIGGGEAWVFHLTNLLLHIFNVILVFLCVQRLMKEKRFQVSGVSESVVFFVSFATALLFALHPIQVEAVAWAAARKDLLSSFFFLGSLLAYVLSAKSHKLSAWYWFSIFLFLLALLSKVSVAPFPLILLLVDWLQGRKINRRVLVEKIPFLALSLIFIAVAFIGKTGNVASAGPMALVALALQGIALQFFHLFLPIRLSVLYPASSISLFSPATLIAVVIILITLGLILMARRKNVSERFLILFGALFFLLMLVPSFFSVMKAEHLYVTADRYVYLASIGVFLVIAPFLERLQRKLSSFHFPLSTSAGIVFIFLLIPFTIHQSLVWRDTMSLFQAVLKIAPENAIAHMNLGGAARLKGNADLALSHYRKSYAAEPTPAILGNIAEVLTVQAKYAEAEKAYDEAIRLKPKDAGLLFGRGTLELFRGKKEEAAKFFLEAIALDPLHSGSHHKLAILLGEKGDKEGAVTHYRAALQADPLLIDSRYNLAVELALLEKRNEAIIEYQELFRISPEHLQALVNYGILLYEENNFSLAREQFQKALEIDPKNEIATRGLALTVGR